jgi:FlaA1/EpsC-like NDP-sugar epimerase
MNASEESQVRWVAVWARSHRLLASVLSHALLFALSWFFAFGLAYNFTRFDTWVPTFFLPLLPVVVVLKLFIFGLMGLHRSSWRYVSLRDVLQITAAAWWAFVGILLVYSGLVYLPNISALLGMDPWQFDLFRGQDFPDSVLLLDCAGTIALAGGARLAVRLYHEEVQPVPDGPTPKLLILGAGDAGETVVREILRQPVLQYRVVGFLDDDPNTWGTIIHSVEVLGEIDRIKEFCDEYAVDEILIAMPSATRKEIRRVVDLCQGTNLRFKTLPAMSDLITGRAKVQQIREVDINDLLGRAPVRLDDEQIAEYIKGRVVLVTGAGGSIGSEMCRQIAPYAPARLLLLEQAEQNLFDIDRELRARFPDLDIVACVADICDEGRMRAIFSQQQPAAVFHAAAHKHVPMMELNPGEAVKNNIRGTRVVADAAARHACEKFVLISTDKAVNPTSIMGGTKRVAEMYTQGLNERVDTEYVTVRFGNVLGSSGSVVPIFKEQIARGGPVTVTHPDMVRYFMTIPEASQLVLQAGSMGNGGEIFVLDMGEPVRIVDLARDLITLSGFRPGEDIEIVFSGVRPGEKLFEELSIEGEDVSRTSHPKIGIWTKRSVDWDDLKQIMDGLMRDADTLDRETTRERLRRIVPEFHLETPGVVASSPPATETTPAA